MATSREFARRLSHIVDSMDVATTSGSSTSDRLNEVGAIGKAFDIIDSGIIQNGINVVEKFDIDLDRITTQPNLEPGKLTLTHYGIASLVYSGMNPNDGQVHNGDPERLAYGLTVASVVARNPNLSYSATVEASKSDYDRIAGDAKAQRDIDLGKYNPSTGQYRTDPNSPVDIHGNKWGTRVDQKYNQQQWNNVLSRAASESLGIGSSGYDVHGGFGAIDQDGSDNDSISNTAGWGSWGASEDDDLDGDGFNASGGNEGGAGNDGPGSSSGGPSGAETHGAGFGASDHDGSDNDSLGGGSWGGGSDAEAGSGGGDSSGKPVVIDMDGDGIELTPLSESVTTFDFDNDDFNELTAWTAGDDALLVFDLENDGQVTQAKEIAFAQWTEADDTDLEALASEFDSNRDGVLDQNDTNWASFKVWQDRDLNGEVGEGEMRSLDEAGIRSIGLETRDNTAATLPDGTVIHGLVDVQRDNGEIVDGADVAFAYNSLGFRTYIDAGGDRVYQFEDGEIQKSKLLSETDTDFNLGDTGSAWIAAEGNILANRLDASAKAENILLFGDAGDDVLLGGAGNDFLIGGSGADSLSGGAGHDLLFADSDDLNSSATIDGGEGYDQLIITDDVAVNLNVDDLAIEAVTSGAGADIIQGTDNSVNYVFDAAAGDDHLSGAGGNDLLLGGEGADTLKAYSGDDTLLGQNGADVLDGGDGDDFLAGGAGDDSLKGGAGNDTYYYNRGDGKDRIYDYAEKLFVEKYEYKETVEYQEKYNYHEKVSRSSFYGKRSEWVNELRTGYRTATREEVRVGEREVLREVDGGIDTLQFGIGIALSDIVLSRSGDDMIVELRDPENADLISADQIIIEDWADQKNRIENFSFADGNRLDFSQITQATYGLGEEDQIDGTAEGDFLSGGKGDDNLKGNAGRDILTGGEGSDFLSGGNGKDLLFGGAGDDVIEGGQGDDYLIGAEGTDKLTGGAGKDVLVGMDGVDVLLGGDGDDLLLGGSGADSLQGGAGDDTYIYFRGDGKDEIHDFKQVEETYSERYLAGKKYQRSGKSGRWVNDYRTRTKTRTVELDAGNDKLQFGYSIALADLFFETQGDDLLIGIRDLENAGKQLVELDDQLTIKHWAHDENRIETLEFITGLQLDMSDITYARSGYEADDLLQGTDGGDILSGGDGNDQLKALAGNDYLIGGLGDDDLFGGAGDDDLFGGEGNDTLTGAGGDDYLIAGSGNDILKAGAGADVLISGAGDDVMQGGLGNDVYIVNRGDGKDVIDETAYADVQESYTYTERVTRPQFTWKGQSFGGMVTVNETRTGYRTVTRAVEGGDDTIQFGAYIDISDLMISMSGNDLLIQLQPLDDNAEVTDQVTIKEWISPEFRVENLRFANDFAVDLGQIEYAASGTENDDKLTALDDKSSWLGGGEGSDELTGSSQSDVLFAGTGADVVSGGNGDDVYIFNRGDGHDRLADSGSTAVGDDPDAPGGDKLLFGTGITIEDLVLQRDGHDLHIYVRNYTETETQLSELNDSVLITNWADQSDRIEVLQFFDGKDFDISQVANTYLGQDLLSEQSSPVNDDLTGSAVSDWLDGFAGDDVLHAGGGDDYLFGRTGNDKLYGQAGKDILSGGAGDDYLAGGDQNDLLAGDSGNDELRGGKGYDILLGGSGDDAINGGEGDDYIIGDTGADTFTASKGFDIYKFGFGDGQDSYSGSNQSDLKNSDVFVMEDDVRKESIWFERVDNDLVLRLLGSEDSIRFSGWYQSNAAEKSVLGFQAGENLLYSTDVSQLVSAMASFEPNDGSTAYGVRGSELPDPVKVAVDSAWKAA